MPHLCGTPQGSTAVGASQGRILISMLRETGFCLDGGWMKPGGSKGQGWLALWSWGQETHIPEKRASRQVNQRGVMAGGSWGGWTAQADFCGESLEDNNHKELKLCDLWRLADFWVSEIPILLSISCDWYKSYWKKKWFHLSQSSCKFHHPATPIVPPQLYVVFLD